jgi:hypothetical protein
MKSLSLSLSVSLFDDLVIDVLLKSYFLGTRQLAKFTIISLKFIIALMINVKKYVCCDVSGKISFHKIS